jgi:hypothetical protein
MAPLDAFTRKHPGGVSERGQAFFGLSGSEQAVGRVLAGSTYDKYDDKVKIARRAVISRIRKLVKENRPGRPEGLGPAEASRGGRLTFPAYVAGGNAPTLSGDL